MAKKSTPVVRVPGLSRDDLRLIDRAATARRLSRAAYIRDTVLKDARWLLSGGEGSRLEPKATPAPSNSLRPSLGTPQRPIRTPADAEAAIAKAKPGPLIKTFDPDTG